MCFLDFTEQSQDAVVDNVGARANDDADDFGDFQSLLIDGLQLVKWFVGVRKRLEISEILACPAVTALVKFDAFLNLLPDGFFRVAVGRVEGRVAAKSAAARADSAVAVGTTEARVDADFLHPSAELLREIVAVTVESAIVAPRKSHSSCFLSQNHQN